VGLGSDKVDAVVDATWDNGDAAGGIAEIPATNARYFGPRRNDAADDVVSRTALNGDTIVGVGQGGGAGGGGADVVAFDHVCGSSDPVNEHAIVGIAADDVAGPGGRAADDIAGRRSINADAIAISERMMVGVQRGGAGDVGADEIA